MFTVKSGSTKGNILIVDDEFDLCQLLAGILVAQQYDVSIAHSLAEANSHIGNSEPDIIFLDNILPDGKGVDFIKTIHQDHRKTKIILMTNALTDPVQEKALRDGAIFLLPKPLSRGVIQIIMNEVSSSHYHA